MAMKPPLLVHGAHLERLRTDWQDEYEVHLMRDFPDLNSFLRGVGAQIEVVVSDGHGPEANLLQAMPRLRLVACFSTGHEGIDTGVLRSRGAALTTAAGVNAHDVADHALALALGAWHGLAAADDAVRSARWREGAPPRRSLRDRRAGILGFGRIGQAVAARLVPHGLEVEWHGPRSRPEVPHRYRASLLELARDSDILFVCCRAEAANRHVVDESVLAALGPQGVLVNVSRGSLVDEEALIRCLRDGRLGGAALDVFEREPADAARWAGVPRALLTPHIAGYTQEAGPAMFERLRENVRRHYANEPLLTPAW